ncbi:energy transducer TonB [Christiangramia sabulilitoris]|uniref:Energy transducer TonB n=1 Tax=Christiangramia sabulilitoris TaxID=2583991 RepID=A0A550HZH2_9FLAO|nr:energy transducer TonB [Christiangramia sabulilitoris]TRO64129.1 energy transducer TonB [Christiangramia sabulilitoris]
MKKLLIIAFLFSAISGFAQEDVDVDGNKVTMRETAPVWKGCEDNADQKACFNKMLMQHIRENIKYSKNAKGEYIRGKAVVKMKVNEEGKVVVNSVESKYPELKKEAIRLMESIPTMTPGKLGGKPKAIKYTIPINF